MTPRRPKSLRSTEKHGGDSCQPREPGACSARTRERKSRRGCNQRKRSPRQNLIHLAPRRSHRRRTGAPREEAQRRTRLKPAGGVEALPGKIDEAPSPTSFASGSSALQEKNPSLLSDRRVFSVTFWLLGIQPNGPVWASSRNGPGLGLRPKARHTDFQFYCDPRAKTIHLNNIFGPSPIRIMAHLARKKQQWCDVYLKIIAFNMRISLFELIW